MHIVLLILKIIGAILGGLIGLLLSLVLLVLFVPVRYQVHLISAEEVYAKVRFHWLLHILHISVIYEEKKTKTKIRIFGIPIKQNRNRKKSRKSNLNRNKNSKNDRKIKSNKIKEEQLETKKQPEKITEENTQAINSKLLQNMSEKKREDKNEDKHEKKKLEFHPIKNIMETLHRFQQFINSIPQKYSDIKSKISHIRRKKDQILEFIRQEGTKYTLGKGRDSLFELIRYIGPRNLKGYIKFGTGDPCQTGQILAGASILYAYFNPKFSLYPDFEEKKLEADLEAKGRIRTIRFVRIAARLFFDKQIKQCITDLKQLKEE